MTRFYNLAKLVIKWGAVVMAVIKAVEVLIEELEKINLTKKDIEDASIKN
ncbi:MAG: hypothetical protein ACYCZ2_18815 [Lutibacter sp.]